MHFGEQIIFSETIGKQNILKLSYAAEEILHYFLSNTFFDKCDKEEDIIGRDDSVGFVLNR